MGPGGRPRRQTKAGKGEETPAKVEILQRIIHCPSLTSEPQIHNEHPARAKHRQLPVGLLPGQHSLHSQLEQDQSSRATSCYWLKSEATKG